MHAGQTLGLILFPWTLAVLLVAHCDLLRLRSRAAGGTLLGSAGMKVLYPCTSDELLDGSRMATPDDSHVFLCC
jgi:hypothetical protein